MTFKVIQPGLMTTIQDIGRRGHQALGFTTAGVLDYQSAILANQLVGNDSNSALIELTLQGISFEVLENTRMATAGAPMEYSLNGVKLPIGRSVSLKKGDFVAFGITHTGLRTYLAVSGGFFVEKVLGSVSTHVRSKIGPNGGSPIQAGDILFSRESERISYPWVIKEEIEKQTEKIRLIPGPEYQDFTEEAKKTLVRQPYVVQNDSDRMGIRLSGEGLETKTKEHDILSAPTQLGNIQVPKSGQPIILLNDRQTTGGYKRIATVAKVDIPKLVQKRPNETIHFEMIDLESASNLYKQKMEDLLTGKYLELDHEFTYFRRTQAEKINQLLMRE